MLSENFVTNNSLFFSSLQDIWVKHDIRRRHLREKLRETELRKMMEVVPGKEYNKIRKLLICTQDHPVWHKLDPSQGLHKNVDRYSPNTAIDIIPGRMGLGRHLATEIKPNQVLLKANDIVIWYIIKWPYKVAFELNTGCAKVGSWLSYRFF